MPIYSVDPRGPLVRCVFAKSPSIALETDAATVDTIPAAVRLAADSQTSGSLFGFSSGEVPCGFDGVITWLGSDISISASAAAIRHDLRVPGRRTFVPVHTPCLDEMPLLTIQPRWFRAGLQAEPIRPSKSGIWIDGESNRGSQDRRSWGWHLRTHFRDKFLAGGQGLV